VLCLCVVFVERVSGDVRYRCIFGFVGMVMFRLCVCM
jgi:hypothetical protein